MVRFRYLALSVLLLGFLSRPTSGEDVKEKKAEELSWAKGLATDFLDAAFNFDLEAAENLMDSSLKTAFAKDGEHRLREWLNNSIAIHEFRSPVIASETIAPDQDEASFKGKFTGKSRRLQFSLRVVKDKGSGKWRVGYFRFRDIEDEK